MNNNTAYIHTKNTLAVFPRPTGTPFPSFFSQHDSNGPGTALTTLQCRPKT